MGYGIEQSPHLGGYLVGGDDTTYATEVWDWMVKSGIKSVIDVGCGEGHSVKYFYDKGCDVVGIEGGYNAIANSPIANRIVCHDYTKGPYVAKKIYDAVWSCEFVEHVAEQYVDNFLETFNCANSIFMTHAVPGQDGYHHVNCQPQEYWIDKLNNLGFTFDNNMSQFLRGLTQKYHVHKRLLYFKR